MLGASKKKEQEKEKKYKHLSNTVGAEFVPFIIETHGGLGPQAEAFLSSLHTWSIENCLMMSSSRLIQGLRFAIACIVQRGNALIMQSGRARSLLADHPNFG